MKMCLVPMHGVSDSSRETGQLLGFVCETGHIWSATLRCREGGGGGAPDEEARGPQTAARGNTTLP